MTIAVTGHRDVVIDETLLLQLDNFFREMSKKYEHIILLSALADGADQCVAESALKYENIDLKVPLPFREELYLETIDNKENFYTLVQSAKETFEVPKVCENPYENLGYYLVDNSDVLLALWDGDYNGKVGGTGQVVTFAKEVDRQLTILYVKRKNDPKGKV